jgi:hypothetical protein
MRQGSITELSDQRLRAADWGCGKLMLLPRSQISMDKEGGHCCSCHLSPVLPSTVVKWLLLNYNPGRLKNGQLWELMNSAGEPVVIQVPPSRVTKWKVTLLFLHLIHICGQGWQIPSHQFIQVFTWTLRKWGSGICPGWQRKIETLTCWALNCLKERNYRKAHVFFFFLVCGGVELKRKSRCFESISLESDL